LGVSSLKGIYTCSEWVGEARLFGNFFLEATLTTAPEINVTGLNSPEEACPGEVISASATTSLTGNITYSWESAIISGTGGSLVFSDDEAATTDITVPWVISESTIYKITLTITYNPSDDCLNPITAKYLATLTVNAPEYIWVGGKSGTVNGITYDGYSWNYAPNWDYECEGGEAYNPPNENIDCIIPSGRSHYPRYPRPNNYWSDVAKCKSLVVTTEVGENVAQIQWMQGEDYSGNDEVVLSVYGDMDIENGSIVSIYKKGVIEVGQESSSRASRSGSSDYCSSEGSMEFETGITLVDFNTIHNATAKPAAYNDYTAISTDVTLNNSYNLTVNVNTVGNWTLHTFAWIDWNQDSDFDDPGEAYDLGTATNTPNGSTSASPYSITVPANAVLGTTRMRVSAKWPDDPSPCDSGFDGEVEDYSINVNSDGVAGVGGDLKLYYASLKIYSKGLVKVIKDTDVIGSAANISIFSGPDGPGNFKNYGDISYSQNGSSSIETFMKNSAPVGDYFFHTVGPTVYNQDFHEWGGPEGTGVALRNFDLDILQTFAYQWQEDNGQWLNVYPYPYPIQTGTGLMLSDTTGDDNSFTQTGKILTGDISVPLGHTSGNPSTYDYMELLSNPFPTAVSWESLYSRNSSKVNSTIYIYNATAQAWGSYNAENNTGTNGVTELIQLGQGFFCNDKK